jgi:hypothetical protein
MQAGFPPGARDLVERFAGRTKARAFSAHGLPSPDRGVDRGKGRGVGVFPANEAMGPKRPGVARLRDRRARLLIAPAVIDRGYRAPVFRRAFDRVTSRSDRAANPEVDLLQL